MDENQIRQFKDDLMKAFDDGFEAKLKTVVDPIVAERTRTIVEQLRSERALFGKDRTGLTEKQKMAFAEVAKAAALGISIDTKANEALIPEQDNRGGYLLSKEVASAILRIAASVGLIASQATKWPLSTDELDIPSYRGSFLEGEYLGVDAVGSDTGLTFNQAKLITKVWQLSFVVSKALLADASVNLADWLLALGGEALANMIDKQGIAGTGAPFVGIFNEPDANTNIVTITGTTFAGYRVIEDSSDLIAAVAKSVRPGSVFVMSDTVWAELRVQKDDSGQYLLPQAGAVSNRVLAQYPSGSILQPDGEILGYPVHTSLHAPALSASASGTKFIIFGNLKAFAYGDRGTLEIEEHRSGTFGGKEVAKSYQRGIVLNHRHGLVNALPKAFAIAKTS